MFRQRDAQRAVGSFVIFRKPRVFSLIAIAFATSASLIAVDNPVHATPPRRPVNQPSQSVIKHSYFFVGGSYAGKPDAKIMRGQMYVEKLTPARPSQPFPIVLIHGGAQTATNWMGTPDGREGWAEFFVDKGYVVYMVDQPTRGRSAWQQSVDGALQAIDAQTIGKLFTAPEAYNLWPRAKLHTQWPGSGAGRGQIGDPIFDQFYASQVPYLASDAETQTLSAAAGAALLDKIGPAVLLTHSDSGPIGWLIADRRPALVKAIVAIEPADPPFYNHPGPPFDGTLSTNNAVRPWAITDIPLSYEPAVSPASPLLMEQQSSADDPGLDRCWTQRAPIRSLPNLRGIPVMVMTSEASYHAMYDHCTARYLSQAGVSASLVRLEAFGIRGNGHMMMIEKNNIKIADFIARWVSNHAQ